MSKEYLEALIESIRKAKNITKKPIKLNNPTIKGIKLNSKIIECFNVEYIMSLDGKFEREYLTGLPVIRDETIDYPRYIVEGEIEETIDQSNPSEALNCLDKMAKQIELDEDTDYWEIRNAHKTVEQALIKAQAQEKAFEIITTKNVNIFAIKRDRKTLADFSYNYYIKKWKLYHTGVGEEQILAEEEFNLLKEEV